MNPKILFTDIDGTLLNKDRELSIETLTEIKRISTINSIPVILVSARMPKSMRILQSQLGLFNELICYNGSLILGSEDSAILEDETINSNNSNSIIEKANSFELHYSVFSYDSWMVNKNDEWAERESRNTRVIPENFDKHKLEVNLKKGFHKIMLMGDGRKIDAIQLWLQENLKDQIIFYRSKDTYLEINSSKSTKLNGIRKILTNYKLSFSDAIAIGDNHNDAEMIKYSGIGVAVNNAPEEIKKIADFICPSNVDDGVAITIKKYFDDENIS